jgi:hypothetical protein
MLHVFYFLTFSVELNSESKALPFTEDGLAARRFIPGISQFTKIEY